MFTNNLQNQIPKSKNKNLYSSSSPISNLATPHPSPPHSSHPLCPLLTPPRPPLPTLRLHTYHQFLPPTSTTTPKHQHLFSFPVIPDPHPLFFTSIANLQETSSPIPMAPPLSISIPFLILTLSLYPEVESTSFKIINRCHHTVWPGILTGANRPILYPTGFTLKPGKSRTLSVPGNWSGRLWGRTHCSQDPTGKFSCLTADCGSGKIQCAGSGAEPPATLAEFTLNGDQGLDFYDVSLVDGYNLPMLVVARGGKGGCASTGCLVDLNGACPAGLRVGLDNSSRSVVACKSACEAFGDPRFCCSEGYNTPETCPPTEYSEYSEFFKHACPRSYSYAYDDKTSTFTCAAADYIIILCPAPYTSQKLLGARKEVADLPLVNKTTMYIGHRSVSAG